MRSMKPIGIALAVTAAGLVVADEARAQDAPDIRNIRPAVMLLVDSSGSMERLPDCVCSTAGCRECLPSCNGAPGADERNRWAIVLEALTGRWQSFECSREPRVGGSYAGQFDEGYFIPHHRPQGADQIDDGILDSYAPRAKFGLMTFDGLPTYADEPVLMTETNFMARLTDNDDVEGMFSYGTPRAFTFPGCGEPHMMDNGAQNEDAPNGRLISVGSDNTSDFAVINAAIQNELTQVRPFGGTPIAGMLTDFDYYLDNHPDVAPVTIAGGPGDPYAACRSRYAILLTDGAPNSDMREYGCETDGYSCPYERPTDIAASLCQFNTGTDSCGGDVDGVFVVGFDIDDPEALAVLNDIARAGGTEEALFATDHDTLLQQLAFALNQIAPGTTTRTVPAFGSSGLTAAASQMQFNSGFRVGNEEGLPWQGVLERRRFECNEIQEPEPQPVEEAEGDLFHESLNNQTQSPIASNFTACPAAMPRCLFTVIPSDPANVDGHLAGSSSVASLVTSTSPDGGDNTGTGGAPSGCTAGPALGSQGADPVESDLTFSPFATSNASLTASMLNAADDTERQEIISWIHGLNGTVREDARLGDIYHSSPVLVAAPEQDLPDESFNLFRQRPEVANRPSVVYVGTNDGILHAFVASDTQITSGPHSGTDLEAGQELWGFIPPLLLNKLKSGMASHQWMVDGTPIVKDVFTRRLPGQAPDGSIYQTVLVVGMRGGAAGYVALDVTDPLEPEFLWQFTDPRMGLSFGVPGIGQVLVEGDDGLQERAIAILPGGTGDDLTASSSTCGAPATAGGEPTGCAPTGTGLPSGSTGATGTPRSNIRCWDERGRHLYFLDLATGERIGHLDDTVFNSPLTGGVSLFTGDVGTVATRAFVSDQDGVIWRIDMASTSLGDWDAEPFHDVFYDEGAVDGQPAYFPPILTTDNFGDVVVLQATGDIDALDGVAENKVVSLKEALVFDATGAVDSVDTVLNWEVPLDPGEQVTGPLELFDGRVYFGSFIASTNPLDACAFGSSRLWGVEYLRSMESDPDYPRPALEIPDPLDPGSTTTVHHTDPFENQIVMGVSITQRPRCIELAEVSETDPYLGSYSTQEPAAAGGGQFQLVAQVSGGGAASAGGSVGEIAIDLPPVLSFTRAQSFAGSVQ